VVATTARKLCTPGNHAVETRIAAVGLLLVHTRTVRVVGSRAGTGTSGRSTKGRRQGRGRIRNGGRMLMRGSSGWWMFQNGVGSRWHALCPTLSLVSRVHSLGHTHVRSSRSSFFSWQSLSSLRSNQPHTNEVSSSCCYLPALVC
jgi:hypothetical protein